MRAIQYRLSNLVAGLRQSGTSLLPFYLTTVFGLVMSGVLFLYFVGVDHERVTERLQRGTNALIQAVTTPLPGTNPFFDTVFTTMDSLRDDLGPGREVDQAYLDSHFWETPPPGFETSALEYLPRVTFSERNELGTRFGARLPENFRIREIGEDGDGPAGARDDYFPVLFESSTTLDTGSIGLDRGANPLMRAALEQARDTGELATYSFYPLVGAGDQTMVTRFFYAVYESGGVPDTLAERQQQLLGVVSLATYFDTRAFADLLPESYQGMEAAFVPLATYRDKPVDPVLRAGINNGTVAETVYQLPAENYADWVALTRATPEMVESMASPTRWWVVSIGLLFTLWAGSMILWLRNYSLSVMKLVHQRTSELAGQAQTLKEVNQALKMSETRYRILADNATDVIFTCDLDGTCTYISPSITRHSGFAVSDYIGHPVTDYMTLESAQQLRVVLEKLKRARAGIPDTLNDNFIAEYGLRCRDDTVKPTENMLSILQDDDGLPNGILVVSRDITERKNSESEKKVLEEAYRQSQKMEAIGTLAGGVAHDFNNLLTGILGHTELLKMHFPADSDTGNGLDVIEKAALRAKELTGQLLGFARKGRYQQVTVDLNDIIADLSALMTRTIDKYIEVSVEVCADSPLVTGDPAQLGQMFLNLAVNARDAMPEGGTMTMTIAVVALDEAFCTGLLGDIPPGKYCEVAISDTGVGMSRQKMSRIFEPFYTDKEKGQGTGMGLAMVYGVARNHGGSITVESEPGQGSTFRVYLPYSGKAPVAGKAPQEKQVLVPGEGTILLVDDESLVRDMTGKMLEVLGYNVVVAEDGEEGVRIYQEQADTIDLVIIDMVMPKMNGIDCLHALMEINRAVKVIIATGFSQDAMTEKFSRERIQGFLQKPFDIQQLSEQVAMALETKVL